MGLACLGMWTCWPKRLQEQVSTQSPSSERCCQSPAIKATNSPSTTARSSKRRTKRIAATATSESTAISTSSATRSVSPSSHSGNTLATVAVPPLPSGGSHVSVWHLERLGMDCAAIERRTPITVCDSLHALQAVVADVDGCVLDGHQPLCSPESVDPRD